GSVMLKNVHRLKPELQHGLAAGSGLNGSPAQPKRYPPRARFARSVWSRASRRRKGRRRRFAARLAARVRGISCLVIPYASWLPPRRASSVGAQTSSSANGGTTASTDAPSLAPDAGGAFYIRSRTRYSAGMPHPLDWIDDQLRALEERS